MRWPFTEIRPPWIFSRWFTQRMKVVLPEPDAPMTTTTSCRLTVIDTPLRTCSRPNHFSTPVASTTTSVAGSGTPPMAPSRSWGFSRAISVLR